MSVQRTVFECSDLRRHIINFIKPKYVPHRICDIKLCAKILNSYEEELLEFMNDHPKTIYNPITDNNDPNNNIYEYILEFIKFSDGFMKVEESVKSKWPMVRLYIGDFVLAEYRKDAICVSVSLIVSLGPDDSEMDIKKFLWKEFINLNEPWVAFLSRNFEFRIPK
jgi:hypothetical protein